MEHILNLKFTLPSGYNTSVIMDESGTGCGEKYRMVLSPTEKEFVERVGLEIWSWVSMWLDEANEEEQ